MSALRLVAVAAAGVLAAWLLALAGFAAWVAATPSGAAWAIAAGARFAGGSAEAQGARGSLLRGLGMEKLALTLPGTAVVEAVRPRVRVRWRALLDGRLDVAELGADDLRVNLLPSDGPSGSLVLPLEVNVDRLALGALRLEQDGRALPVALADIALRASLGKAGQRLWIERAAVATDAGDARLRATVRGEAGVGVQQPLPLDLSVQAEGTQDGRPFDLAARATGTLGDLAVSLRGSGAGVGVDAEGRLDLEQGFPLRGLRLDLRGVDPAAWVPGAPAARLDARADLTVAEEAEGPVLGGAFSASNAAPRPLARGGIPVAALSGRLRVPLSRPDAVELSALAVDMGRGGRLSGALRWGGSSPGAHHRAALKLERFDPAPWLAGAALPPASLSGTVDADGALSPALAGRASLNIAAGSRFGGQPLSGHADVRIAGADAAGVDADVTWGDSHLRAQGAFGKPGDSLRLDLDVKRLERLAPSLPAGGLTAKGVLRGSPASHEAELDAAFTPADGRPSATVGLGAAGGWHAAARDAPAGWRGALKALRLAREPYGLELRTPLDLSVTPGAQAPRWQAQAGAAQFALRLPGGRGATLEHEASSWGAGRWATRGGIRGLAWAPANLADELAGKPAPLPPDRLLVVDGDWDLSFADALHGTASLKRRSGDVWLPGAQPLALGLQTLEAQLRAEPEGMRGRSRIDLHGEVTGTRVGRARVDGQAYAQARGGSLALDGDSAAFADLDADFQDLAWLDLLTGDSTEIGGKLAGKARVEARGGQWHASGALHGSGLRLVRLDDGVRLLDGTLEARLADDRIVLDGLHFPARQRVRPGDARVRDWLAGEGKDGALDLTGLWSLADNAGKIELVAKRFPIIQRADRFVALSGQLGADLAPGSLRVAGSLDADAGWVDLGAQAPASLSDDVHVTRAGGAPPAAKATAVAIDVTARLGDRFYLRGYGLDTAITGQLRVTGDGAGLRADGALRTREGRFDAYGQSLTVQRGVVTFQGSLDDPLLDVVAVRAGPAVEAGVQIGGTARRPRIALVSTPDVSDVEKLSWLLLGHGPDDSRGGADASLLLGAATTLLGPSGSEPISRQLGLDEVAVRTGNVGSSRGLLPDRTVAGDSTASSYPMATSQYFVVGKRLTDRLNASVEQALSGDDGILQLSWRFTRRLSAVFKGGTVNGLDLLYEVLFDD